MTFDHKPNTTDIGSRRNAHLKGQGFKTPTEGQELRFPDTYPRSKVKVSRHLPKVMGQGFQTPTQGHGSRFPDTYPRSRVKVSRHLPKVMGFTHVRPLYLSRLYSPNKSGSCYKVEKILKKRG
jgi:hypothetical protein